jgi:hypothetical protein
MASPKPNLSKAHKMSYRIGRGEQGVLTFEPYKSAILPLWRFKTPAIARQSSKQIYAKFEEYDELDDFVGMDMCRKFLQMVCLIVRPRDVICSSRYSCDLHGRLA